MEKLYREIEGIFLIDNFYLYKKVKREMTDNGKKTKAYQETFQKLIDWQNNLPMIVTRIDYNYYGDYSDKIQTSYEYYGKKLYGNRLEIEEYNLYLTIDGIEWLNLENQLRAYNYQQIAYILNDIATYGLENYIENYKKTFGEQFAIIERRIDSDIQTLLRLMNENEKDKSSYLREIESLKKKFWNYMNINIQLALWRPLGKTNEEMVELEKKLQELINL